MFPTFLLFQAHTMLQTRVNSWLGLGNISQKVRPNSKQLAPNRDPKGRKGERTILRSSMVFVSRTNHGNMGCSYSSTRTNSLGVRFWKWNICSMVPFFLWLRWVQLNTKKQRNVSLPFARIQQLRVFGEWKQPPNQFIIVSSIAPGPNKSTLLTSSFFVEPTVLLYFRNEPGHKLSGFWTP